MLLSCLALSGVESSISLLKDYFRSRQQHNGTTPYFTTSTLGVPRGVILSSLLFSAYGSSISTHNHNFRIQNPKDVVLGLPYSYDASLADYQNRIIQFQNGPGNIIRLPIPKMCRYCILNGSEKFCWLQLWLSVFRGARIAELGI